MISATDALDHDSIGSGMGKDKKRRSRKDGAKRGKAEEREHPRVPAPDNRFAPPATTGRSGEVATLAAARSNPRASGGPGDLLAT
jgi:hypothetical protein